VAIHPFQFLPPPPSIHNSNFIKNPVQIRYIEFAASSVNCRKRTQEAAGGRGLRASDCSAAQRDEGQKMRGAACSCY
jgi:hypothetical protein